MRARPVSCCFSGHRPAKLPWGEDEDDPRCRALKARLRDALDAAYEAGYRHFICGMAQGCDLYFCELALALRQLCHGEVGHQPRRMLERLRGHRCSGYSTQ